MNIYEELQVPSSIRNVLEGLPYTVDKVGESNSKVLIFEDYILKITSLSFDIENEVRVYYALKGKLPIPEILDYKKENGRIYLLKRKLKGKMLCDEEYLKNPKLLFKLAKEALHMIWSVDIQNVDLMDTYQTIVDFGKDYLAKGHLDFANTDKRITERFHSFEEIIQYLEDNIPTKDNVLTHGDLCIPNIICDGDKVVGFIDLGLTGISHRYHDLAILYRSIRDNMNGVYGKAYPGFDEKVFFQTIGIEKKDTLIEYFLLVDELLG